MPISCASRPLARLMTTWRPNAHMLVALATTSAVFALSRRADAATYKVGPGLQYESLSAVASRLNPGDVVELQGNHTYSGGVLLSRPGSASAKITIRGVREAGKRPVLSGGTNTIELQGSHYVLEGLEITGGSSRCVFHHADDITIRDSVVHDCPSHGILGADAESGSLLLQYVEVYRCGSEDRRHQIYMATDETAFPGSVFRMEHCYVHDAVGGNNVKSRAERNEIYYNWIEGALYHEVELIGPDGQDANIAREDSDVVGNVIRKTRSGYIARVGGDGTGATGGRYRFVNNTIILADSGSSTVFRIFDAIESIEMHNNAVYAPTGSGKIYTDGDASWVGGRTIVGSNNWVTSGITAIPSGWTGTLQGSDPMWTDLAKWDLRPSAKSPLVDAGRSPTASPAGHDFPKPLAAPSYYPPRRVLEAVDTALLRPSAPPIDIGAYESAAVTPSTTPTTGQGGSGGATGTGGSNGQGAAGAVGGSGGKASPGGTAGGGDGKPAGGNAGTASGGANSSGAGGAFVPGTGTGSAGTGSVNAGAGGSTTPHDSTDPSSSGAGSTGMGGGDSASSNSGGAGGNSGTVGKPGTAGNAGSAAAAGKAGGGAGRSGSDASRVTEFDGDGSCALVGRSTHGKNRGAASLGLVLMAGLASVVRRREKSAKTRR